MKIITIDEWNRISDAIFYVRKAYNRNGTADEEKLHEIEEKLTSALSVCGEIKKRWDELDSQGPVRDEDRVTG